MQKPYTPPQFTRLTPREAKAQLTARAVPADANTKQLLEWIAQLELQSEEK